MVVELRTSTDTYIMMITNFIRPTCFIFGFQLNKDAGARQYETKRAPLPSKSACGFLHNDVDCIVRGCSGRVDLNSLISVFLKLRSWKWFGMRFSVLEPSCSKDLEVQIILGMSVGKAVSRFSSWEFASSKSSLPDLLLMIPTLS